jgi:DNA repair protein RadC
MQLYIKDRSGEYIAAPHTAILENIQVIAHGRLTQEPHASPDNAKHFLQGMLALRERETFTVLLLDSQHRLIRADILFEGTIAESKVYPREIIALALKHNAAAIILGHNHPSGDLTFSESDLMVTNEITKACRLMGIRMLDHILVSTEGAISAAEEGKL